MTLDQSKDFSYLDSSLSFKVRKVLRYLVLDGAAKTLAKVRAQYHMVRTEGFEEETWLNPACRSPDHPSRMVGLIGAGKFGHSMVSFYLKQRYPKFLRGVCDLSAARARSLCSDYAGVFATTSPAKIIGDDKIKLVYIASNHAAHAEYAIECLDAGKNVHIEKPHAITDEQLERLYAAQLRNPGCQVFLGFNRPRSEHFLRIKSALGTQSGPTLMSWFVAGHDIPEGHWYYAEGGRALGNLCHWTDATLEFIGIENAFPCELVPASPNDRMTGFSVTMRFKDDSVASFMFSGKGSTFEGVRERLVIRRGDVLASITDFLRSDIEIRDRRWKYRSFHRQHGHGENIRNSFEAVMSGDRSRSVSPQYSLATAKLFLGAKDVIDNGKPMTITLK